MYNEPVKIDTTLFAQRLKMEREKRDVSKAQMARDLNIPASSLSYYEGGLSLPSSDKLYLLAEYLHTSIDYLLGRIDESIEIMRTEMDVADSVIRFANYEGIDLEENALGKPVLAFHSSSLIRYFSNRLEIERLKVDASEAPIPEQFFNAYKKSLLENERFYLNDLRQIPLQPKYKHENDDIRRKRRTAEERKALDISAELEENRGHRE